MPPLPPPYLIMLCTTPWRPLGCIKICLQPLAEMIGILSMRFALFAFRFIPFFALQFPLFFAFRRFSFFFKPTHWRAQLVMQSIWKDSTNTKIATFLANNSLNNIYTSNSTILRAAIWLIFGVRSKTSLETCEQLCALGAALYNRTLCHYY